jgi:esterase
MELHAKVLGQGPALVILHGLFGSLDNWQTLGRRFAESRTVYLVDQRNHGKSPHDPRHDYPAMADDLAAFFDHQGIRSAAVLGHSMGGKTAMRFALDHADRVDALIVADMAPKAYPPGHDLILAALRALDPAEIEDRAQAEAALAETITDSGIRLFLLKNLARDPDGGYRWKMNLPALVEHHGRILEAVDGEHPYEGPVLFLRGGRSGYVEEGDAPAIRALFPAARIEAVEGAGHWLHAERPDAFHDAVTGFLDGLG